MLVYKQTVVILLLAQNRRYLQFLEAGTPSKHFFQIIRDDWRTVKGIFTKQCFGKMRVMLFFHNLKVS